MKIRILLATLLTATAIPALAGDVSHFYKNQFVITEGDSCAKGATHASDVSPFYKNQFVITKAEACAAMAAANAAAVTRAGNADEEHRAAAQSRSEPRS